MKEQEPCPKCGEKRNKRGLSLHLKSCGVTVEVEKVLYPKQKSILSPEAYAMYVRKAEARI